MKRRAQLSFTWILIGLILIGAVVAGAMVALRLSSPMVVVTEAVEGPVVQAFYSTGTIQPEREFPIKANQPGIVTAVHVDKGDVVKAGQPLAVISDPDLVYSARKAEAEVLEKQQRAEPKSSPVLAEFDARMMAQKAQLDIAQREQDRVKVLIERNAATQHDLDFSEDRVKTIWSALESTKAQKAAMQLELARELQVAKSAVDTANWNLDQQTLKAPIDGAVLDRPIAVGTRVAVNDKIMTTANVTPAKLVMRAAVDEEDVTAVHVGQAVRMSLYSYEGRVFEGKVMKIYPQADEARRTFEVDVQIVDPDGRLSPGMTGELTFIIAFKDKAIVVPSQAVQKGAVYAVREGRLEKLDVQVGLRGIERAEVLSGLKTGERIVISSIGDMNPGQNVRTRYTDPAAAAGVNKPKPVNDSFKGFN